jgi:hypothetical protein
MKIGIFFQPSYTTTNRRPKKKNGRRGATVVQLVQLGGNNQKWANNRCSAENFFWGEKIRDFFEPSHTTTYSGPKKYWKGAAQWSTGWK